MLRSFVQGTSGDRALNQLVIVIEKFFETERPAESVAVTANEKVPAASGMPAMMPVLKLIDIPGGIEPPAIKHR